MDFLTPEFVASVGFPIAVAAYLLIRMEKTINNLTMTVDNLTILLAGFKGKTFK